MHRQETTPIPTVKESFTSKIVKVVNWLKWRAMVINPFACGYTLDLRVHDHQGLIMTESGWFYNQQTGRDEYSSSPQIYCAKIHGEIVQSTFLNEGDPLRPERTSTDGRQAIHRHDGRDGLSGPYEYNFEPKPTVNS